MVLGRYLLNDPRSDIMPNLRRNINRFGEFAIQQKLGQLQRERAIKDALETYEGKRKIETKYPKPATTHITITPHKLGTLQEASELINLTPEQWHEMNLATSEEIPIPGTGREGGLFGIGRRPPEMETKYKLKPEAEMLINKAQGVLKSPYQQTIRTTGGTFTGGQQFKKTDTEGIAPDLQMLIDEYQTTNDPQRAKELEQILTSKGVRFE